MELYVVYFLLAIILLIVEVIHGMALGVAFSASLTLGIMGFLTYLNLIRTVDQHLIAGAIIFFITTILVIKKYRTKTAPRNKSEDVNEY